MFAVAVAQTGLNASGGAVEGLTHGGGFDQLWRQAVGVAVVAPYSFIVTFIILKVLDVTMGIRVNEEDEIAGLDVSQHGERAYVFGGGGPVLGIAEAIPMYTTASGRPPRRPSSKRCGQGPG